MNESVISIQSPRRLERCHSLEGESSIGDPAFGLTGITGLTPHAFELIPRSLDEDQRVFTKDSNPPSVYLFFQLKNESRSGGDPFLRSLTLYSKILKQNGVSFYSPSRFRSFHRVFSERLCSQNRESGLVLRAWLYRGGTPG